MHNRNMHNRDMGIRLAAMFMFILAILIFPNLACAVDTIPAGNVSAPPSTCLLSVGLPSEITIEASQIQVLTGPPKPPPGGGGGEEGGGGAMGEAAVRDSWWLVLLFTLAYAVYSRIRLGNKEQQTNQHNKLK
jgi:hypothetical protein